MLFLASKSPRRQELLKLITTDFRLVEGEIEEQILTNESAQDFVLRMAIEKAQAGLKNIDHNKDGWVLGSDTVVVINGQVLGKPKDFSDANQMLQLLSNNKHQVLTAVAIVSLTEQFSKVVTTDVEFREISAQEIEAYWQSGEPHDKAGSYGIQGLAGKFVKRIEGSYFSVVGLPLFETECLLKQACYSHKDK
ncbi:Maf family protein [Thalassotalea crassostreae]|uniref:Maf family protein n=1 Tax=Thalassotalea crassostreae TaxID=1763536 RepID=UPI0008389CB5|nr:Maf family protein [Thalassotalea crassostreae]